MLVMTAYYIAGSNGTGKSTVGEVLEQRGYRVIETDFEERLSAWCDIDTQRRIEPSEMPRQPYPEDWVKSHVWLWDSGRMHELLSSISEEPVFFCGGADNSQDFYNSFTKRFGLYVPDLNTLRARLQNREPQRWVDGSSELAKSISRAAASKDLFISKGFIAIDSSTAPDNVANSILAQI